MLFLMKGLENVMFLFNKRDIINMMVYRLKHVFIFSHNMSNRSKKICHGKIQIGFCFNRLDCLYDVPI